MFRLYLHDLKVDLRVPLSVSQRVLRICDVTCICASVCYVSMPVWCTATFNTATQRPPVPRHPADAQHHILLLSVLVLTGAALHFCVKRPFLDTRHNASPLSSPPESTPLSTHDFSGPVKLGCSKMLRFGAKRRPDGCSIMPREKDLAATQRHDTRLQNQRRLSSQSFVGRQI